MESKDELKSIDIKNCTCYYFGDTIKGRDIYSVHIFLDEKSYETYKNIFVYRSSYKNTTRPKPLRIRLDKIDGFIKVHGGEFRYLVLFDYGLFNKICYKIKYLISEKKSIRDSTDQNWFI